MKQRVDVLLVQKGLAPTRQKAQALIMAGRVYENENKICKASESFEETANLIVRGEEAPFASRGGHKLEKAMLVFSADVRDAVCMDIGAATGGFTDVLLRHGAKTVYAIDVGYGQFAWELRQDPRVKLMERTNARFLQADMFDRGLPSVCVMDVSFISIKHIIPAAISIMGDGGRFLSLVKPQFEAGREAIGKNGVVRDKQVHSRVLKEIRDFADSLGWGVQAFAFSPIKGPKGNIEFLADIIKHPQKKVCDGEIAALVEKAHSEL